MVAELVNKCMSERVSKKVQSLVNDEGPPSAPSAGHGGSLRWGPGSVT